MTAERGLFDDEDEDGIEVEGDNEDIEETEDDEDPELEPEDDEEDEDEEDDEDDEDEDDEEDDEEEEPLPKKRPAAAIDEDDDDALPPKKKRQPPPDEDDEEEPARNAVEVVEEAPAATQKLTDDLLITSMVAPMTAEQIRLRSSCNPELLKVADTILSLGLTARNQNILAHYDIGDWYNTVRDNDNNKYGDKAVENLSALVRVTPTLLYRLGCFAESISRDALKGLITTKDTSGSHPRLTEKGKPITLEQLVTACQVKDKEKIPEIIEKIYETGASAGELRAQLSTTAKKNVRQGGRKPAKLNTPQALVHKTTLLLNKLNNLIETNQGALDSLAEIDEDHIGPELLAKLQAAEQAAIDAGGTARILAGAFASGITRCSDVMNEEEERAKAAEEKKGKATKPAKEKPSKGKPEAKAKAAPAKATKPPEKKPKAKVPEKKEPERKPSRERIPPGRVTQKAKKPKVKARR